MRLPSAQSLFLALILPDTTAVALLGLCALGRRIAFFCA
jgi:hypothetical protein